MNKKIKWILFGLVALLQVICLVWTRGDYRSALIDGSEYEVPANIGFQESFYDKNYLPVHIPLNEAVWKGGNMPEKGETVYLSLAKDDKGMMVISGGSDKKPSGDYITVRALYSADGKVYFDFPADRMYMAPEDLKKLPVVELSERVEIENKETGKTETRMKNEITALIRVKDGRVAISKILANGGPVEKTFTTVGKNLSVKYATSGAEKDEYNETKSYSSTAKEIKN